MSIPLTITDDEFQELTRRVRAAAYLRGCWADLKRADFPPVDDHPAGMRLVFFVSRRPTRGRMLIYEGTLQSNPGSLAAALEQAVSSAASELAKQ